MNAGMLIGLVGLYLVLNQSMARPAPQAPVPTRQQPVDNTARDVASTITAVLQGIYDAVKEP